MSNPEQLHSLINYIPFIGLMAGKTEHSPIITRLVESAIIGGVLLYGTVQILGNDIDWLKMEIGQINNRIENVEHNQVDVMKFMYRNAEKK